MYVNTCSGFACQLAKGFIYQVARLASGTSFGSETIYNFWHAGFLPMLFGPEDTHTLTGKEGDAAESANRTQRHRQRLQRLCDFVAIALQVTAWACACLACLAWLTDFDRSSNSSSSSNRTINKIRPCVATICVRVCV